MMGNMQTDVNILATQEPMKEKKKSSSKEVFNALPFSDFEKLIEFDDKIRADSKLSEKLVILLFFYQWNTRSGFVVPELSEK